jgi:hypothetical protein
MKSKLVGLTVALCVTGANVYGSDGSGEGLERESPLVERAAPQVGTVLGGLANQAAKLDTISKDIGAISAVLEETTNPEIERLKQRIGDIENLLCPHINHQRLIWELRGWALIPEWLTQITAMNLLGKRISVERYGNGWITTVDNNHRWTLYCKLNPTYKQLMAISHTDMEAAYVHLQSSYSTTYRFQDEVRKYIHEFAKYASEMHIGTNTDAQESGDTDQTLADDIAFFLPAQTDGLTAARIAKIPTRCENYKSYTKDGAFLRIEVLPED